ncbi:MAG: hypothetical protein UV26_C0030G0006 [candidate division WWE3 bacterium GW2011_GWF2_42_42]|uniref:Uncharacterized protein n=1 Tax=candidate division WWE3 bacterium GW2011_GWF2_42_42 TaxID=1619142 RepID=A0A0G1ADR2_UNCKA|nr:MAG: hypothetical protein UV26_C0030G0006 [candidate division WWE3 bacterium GW2011_GWF2_42_42]
MNAKLTKLGFTQWEMSILKAMKKNIYCNICSVSKSGISRKMKFYTVFKGKIINCTVLIASVLDNKTNFQGEIKVSGCGMDMVYHVLTNFNYAICKKLTGKLTKNYNDFWVNADKYGRI